MMNREESSGDVKPAVESSEGERLDGNITGWEKERGFGWVAHEGGSLFAHISEFHKGFIPRKGDLVTFVIGPDPKGRPCAKSIIPARKNLYPTVKAILKLLPLLVLPFLANLKLPIAGWMLPAAVLPTSVAAWMLFRYDKMRAAAGGWRVTETELHGLEFFGGWPGAFLAQRMFHHKTRKLSYQAIFWSIVFLYQLVALDMVLDHYLWNEAVAFWKDWMLPNVE